MQGGNAFHGMQPDALRRTNRSRHTRRHTRLLHGGRALASGGCVFSDHVIIAMRPEFRLTGPRRHG
jgi:hypothetical protein